MALKQMCNSCLKRVKRESAGMGEKAGIRREEGGSMVCASGFSLNEIERIIEMSHLRY